MKNFIGPQRYSTSIGHTQAREMNFGNPVGTMIGAVDSVYSIKHAHENALAAEEKRQQREEDRQARELERADLMRQREEERRFRDEQTVANRFAREEARFDAMVERNTQREINDFFRQQQENDRRLRRNEEEVARQAFAREREDRLNRPGSTKHTMDSGMKGAISALENLGFDKRTATAAVEAVYVEGMTEEELIRAALKGMK